MRKTIAEQEKTKEMEDLYLPPRRKNMQQNNADSSKYNKNANLSSLLLKTNCKALSCYYYVGSITIFR